MIKKTLKTTLIIMFWIAVWHIASMIINSPLLFPSPYQTLIRLIHLMGTWDFYITLSVSILRIFTGTLIAIIFSILIALATAKFRILHDFIYPIMTVIKSIPVASFIVLLLLWTGRDVVPSLISFLIVIPIVWSNVETGILHTDKCLVDMSRAYNMDFFGRLRHVYAPSTLPYFISSLTSCIGLAWKAGIAAEVLALPAISMGKEIFNSKLYLETTDLFAWTLAVVLLSLVFEKLVVFGIKKLSLGMKKVGGTYAEI